MQTSRGNYLADLSVRSENIDFKGNSIEGTSSRGLSAAFAKNMDDLILRAVAWQANHFVNRLPILDPNYDRAQPIPSDVSQVVLVSFDRNLRLKARALKLDAANEQDLSRIISGKGSG